MNLFSCNTNSSSYKDYLTEKTRKCEKCGLSILDECKCALPDKKYIKNIKSLRVCGLVALVAIATISLVRIVSIVSANNLSWFALASMLFLVSGYYDVMFAYTRTTKYTTDLTVVVFMIVFTKLCMIVFVLGPYPDSMHCVTVYLILFSIPTSAIATIAKFFYLCVFYEHNDFGKFINAVVNGAKKAPDVKN